MTDLVGSYNPDANWTPDEPLPNVRHELLCLNILAGQSYAEAARNAGIGRDSTDPAYATMHASRLLRQNPHVRQRITWLRTFYSTLKGADISRWLEELMAVITTKITDVVEWGVRPKVEQAHIIQDPDTGDYVDSTTGDIIPPEELQRMEPYAYVKPSNEIPEHTAKAIKKITIRSVGLATEIQVEMHDKVRTLDMLGRYLKAYDPNAPKIAGPAELTEEKIAEIEKQGLHQLTNEQLAEMRKAAWATIKAHEAPPKETT